MVSGPGVENVLKVLMMLMLSSRKVKNKPVQDLLNRTLQLASNISQQTGEAWSYDASSFMEKLSKDAAEMQDSFRDQGMGMVEARTKTFEAMNNNNSLERRLWPACPCPIS
jgi:hypothetical protein